MLVAISPTAAIGRSISITKTTWGENVGAHEFATNKGSGGVFKSEELRAAFR